MVKSRYNVLAIIALSAFFVGFAGNVLAQDSVVKYRALGKCLLKKDYKNSLATVTASPGSKDEAKGFASLRPALEKCGADPEVELDDDGRTLLLGGISEKISNEFELIKEKLLSTDHGVNIFSNLAAIKTKGYPPRAALAACLFEIDAMRSVSFVRSARNSKREASVLESLQPSMVHCVDQGSEISLTRPSLKSEMFRAYVRYMSPAVDSMSVSPTWQKAPTNA